MFVGREDLLEQLTELWRKPVPSLVTCRGRRRIGKSTLIEEFARRSRVRFLKLEGLQPREGVTNETQLMAFSRQLAEQTGTARAKGCQIDLLIQARHTIYVVEVKRRESIGEEIVEEVREKIRRLCVRRSVSVIPVLIYDGRLSRRISADGFFARTISAERMLYGRERSEV